MATRSLDGCRVIKAAEQRLSFADRSEKALRAQARAIQKQETALQSQLGAIETAYRIQVGAIRAQLKATKSQLKATGTQIAAAQGEVKEATTFLEETREKLQVIDVDEDDGAESGDRKRKTTASLTPDKTENREGEKARVDSLTVNGDIAKTIVVGGAGAPEANGMYRLCSSQERFPTWADRRFPVWSKDGRWRGKATTFYIFRSTDTTSAWWWMYDERFGDELYRTSGESTNLPPTSGWCEGFSGTSPPPKLEW